MKDSSHYSESYHDDIIARHKYAESFNNPNPNIRIAIIGGGVAGMGAAKTLVETKFPVTLYEINERLGGDALAIDIKTQDGKTVQVDGGVSDFNLNTYFQFRAFLEEFGAADYTNIRNDVSFSSLKSKKTIRIEEGKCYFQDADIDPLLFLQEIERFSHITQELSIKQQTTMDVQEFLKYLRKKKYSEDFINFFLIPKITGAWLVDVENLNKFPIDGILKFFKYHGIIGGKQGKRVCIKKGIYTYADCFAEWFISNGGNLKLHTQVNRIFISQNFIEVETFHKERGKRVEHFDHVIFATKPKQALNIIGDANQIEYRILSTYPTNHADVYYHYDERVMPSNKKAWAAFNYYVYDEIRKENPNACVTYWLNYLQQLPSEFPNVFTTVNPPFELDPTKIYCHKRLEHPLGLLLHRDISETSIHRVQGDRRLWFCGSYVVPPFLQENAYVSGLSVAERLIRNYLPHFPMAYTELVDHMYGTEYF